MEHYKFWITYRRQDLYLIWHSGDDSYDGFHLTEDGLLPAFRSDQDLKSFAEQQGLTMVEEEAIRHNLDLICSWLKAPACRHINCPQFLAAYNMFVDLSSSINGKNMNLEDKVHDRIYDKLFFGSNLPAVTDSTGVWHPRWTRKDRAEIRQVLSGGMNLLRQRIAVR